MNIGKKVNRINPFNEEGLKISVVNLKKDAVNPRAETSTNVNSDIPTDEFSLNSSAFTKSKKKRLRIKKAKLRLAENQVLANSSDKKQKLNCSEIKAEVVSVDVKAISNNNNLKLDSIQKFDITSVNIKPDGKPVKNLLMNKNKNTAPISKDSEEATMKTNNSNQEKSREEILAERQAKKMSKLKAKKKDQNETSTNLNIDVKNSGNAQHNASGETNSNVSPNVTKSDAAQKHLVGVNKTQTLNVNKGNNSFDEVDGCIAKRVVDIVDGEIGIRVTLPIFSKNSAKLGKNQEVISVDKQKEAIDVKKQSMVTTDKSPKPVDNKPLDNRPIDRGSVKPPNVLIDLNVDVKSDKSREEVMAEREAKKLAKLAKKQQGKGVAPNTVKKNIPVESIPEDSDKQAATTEKSKAELKAERRAKQEAQRAAKEAQKKTSAAPPVVVEKKIVKKSPEIKKDVVKSVEKVSEIKVHHHKLFSHLCIEPQGLDVSSKVHPVIVELGKKYSTRVVSGSNARCVSLLLALKQVINDYKVSVTSDLNRGLEAELTSIGTYLAQARPLSVSMTNSLRYLRSHLTQTSDLPDDEAKKRLLESIDTFIREQVDVAGEAISNTVQEKISNGDVILTYGCSSLVWRCLKESYQAGKEFSVVVVDGGPWYEGRELLRRLAALSIPCTYLLISAVGFAITKISKVLLGAHALLANGYVMSRTGSAMIALTASAHSVPVLVCCETYKFCERVQADAYVYNELGGGEEACLKGVKWLSPIYDITPPDLVTAVVTELAILPCTSVPVVLRVKPSDIHHAT